MDAVLFLLLTNEKADAIACIRRRKMFGNLRLRFCSSGVFFSSFFLIFCWAVYSCSYFECCKHKWQPKQERERERSRGRESEWRYSAMWKVANKGGKKACSIKYKFSWQFFIWNGSTNSIARVKCLHL